MQYRQVAGRLIKPGMVIRKDGTAYKIESIEKIPGAKCTLRAQTSTSTGPRPLLMDPDEHYDVRQLPADVQMAQFISQLARGLHDASRPTVDAARKLLDNISGEAPLAAGNQLVQDMQDTIDRAVTDGILPG
jgi:hypothetical protein